MLSIKFLNSLTKKIINPIKIPARRKYNALWNCDLCASLRAETNITIHTSTDSKKKPGTRNSFTEPCSIVVE